MDLHRVLQEQRDWTATLIVNRPSVEMCRVESQWGYTGPLLLPGDSGSTPP